MPECRSWEAIADILRGNVTPADVYYGRKVSIPARREEVERRTSAAGKGHNRFLGKLDSGSSTS